MPDFKYIIILYDNIGSQLGRPTHNGGVHEQKVDNGRPTATATATAIGEEKNDCHDGTALQLSRALNHSGEDSV